MKITCSGLDISEAALKVSKAISNKSIGGVLEGIKFEAEKNKLVMSATDLELSIKKEIKADVLIDGETVVPGRIFCELIKKLSNEEIELVLNEKNQLIIKYGENEVSLQCFKPEEFPNFKKIESAESFEISEKDLKELINKSIISVASDDSRPILKGVLIEVSKTEVNGVALDGFRLGVITRKLVSSAAQLSVVVPARSLIEISKLLGDSNESIPVYIQKNYLMVKTNEAIVVTRLLDGDFMNYKKIIPLNQSIKINVNRLNFEQALERASLLSRIDRNNVVILDISSDIMQITSSSEAGGINEKVIISGNGVGLKIAFNAKYLIEALKNIDDEFINITFESKNDPCLIVGENYIYLVSPMRLP